jgi:small-conductance mechanosensitive channel
LTALGVGGLAVALALQDTLSNLFAGIHIISTRLVLPNDYIRLSTGEEGFCKDINWRNTIIRTMANNENIIPNSVLSSSILTNFSRPEQEINISIPVSVSYESDLSQVEEVCIAVAKKY